METRVLISIPQHRETTAQQHSTTRPLPCTVAIRLSIFQTERSALWILRRGVIWRGIKFQPLPPVVRQFLPLPPRFPAVAVLLRTRFNFNQGYVASADKELDSVLQSVLKLPVLLYVQNLVQFNVTNLYQWEHKCWQAPSSKSDPPDVVPPHMSEQSLTHYCP